jgi:hypothetical protein
MHPVVRVSIKYYLEYIINHLKMATDRGQNMECEVHNKSSNKKCVAYGGIPIFNLELSSLLILSKSSYNQQSVGQSDLVPGHHLEPTTN